MIEISPGVFYFKGATNIGIFGEGKEVVMIDTGIDDDVARKVLRKIRENGMEVVAVINTHSHADHIGGNNFLQRRTSCRIYCPAEERSLIEFPESEAFYLFSGASPPKGLRNKFICAKPSRVERGLVPEERLELAGKRARVISLRGHSPGQIGIEVDGILFCADSFFSEKLLEKYKIPFFSDVKSAKKVIEDLMDSNYSFYVPSHVNPGEDLSEIMEANLRRISEIRERVLEACDRSWIEEVVVKAMKSLGAKPGNLSQFLLLRTALLSYISWLEEDGEIELRTEGSRVICLKIP